MNVFFKMNVFAKKHMELNLAGQERFFNTRFILEVYMHSSRYWIVYLMVYLEI